MLKNLYFFQHYRNLLRDCYPCRRHHPTKEITYHHSISKSYISLLDQSQNDPFILFTSPHLQKTTNINKVGNFLFSQDTLKFDWIYISSVKSKHPSIDATNLEFYNSKLYPVSWKCYLYIDGSTRRGCVCPSAWVNCIVNWARKRN